VGGVGGVRNYLSRNPQKEPGTSKHLKSSERVANKGAKTQAWNKKLLGSEKEGSERGS